MIRSGDGYASYVSVNLNENWYYGHGFQQGHDGENGSGAGDGWNISDGYADGSVHGCGGITYIYLAWYKGFGKGCGYALFGDLWMDYGMGYNDVWRGR